MTGHWSTSSWTPTPTPTVGARARFLIDDENCEAPALSDGVLSDSGIEFVLRRYPDAEMNSAMGRWALALRRQVADGLTDSQPPPTSTN